MFDSQVKTMIAEDEPILESWRKAFPEADLEMPNGYAGPGVATAVSIAKDGRLLGSLTGTMILAVSLDPYLKNPEAGRLESLASLYSLCDSMEYQASLNGAIDAYVAIPNLLPEYQKLIVEKCGFEETAQTCRIYRRRIAR
jgi:hypothetical protein